MGTIVIHAGMPKTGSTSIQTWLRTHARYLREQHDTAIVHVAATSEGPTRFGVFESGFTINSISFLLEYHFARQRSASADELRALADDFVSALERSASDHGTMVVSAEGFAILFVAADEPFLQSLDRLAQHHTVRIAYYVRPQHTAIEARWRQWGFRNDMSPSDWVLDQADQLRYADTFDHVRRLAPAISFGVRPFRTDLLEGGNVVVDFAREFLCIEEPTGADDMHENVGLSLDFANLLRGAPASLLDDPGTNVNAGGRQLALGMLGRSWGLEESQAARDSRAVLHRYAYREFEPRNRALVADLHWPTETFVSPPDERAASSSELVDLDELWKPQATETARAYLYAALSDLMNR